MSDFEKIEKEARDLAQSHSSEVDEGITKGEQEIDQRFGDAHASDVQKAGDELEKALGSDQPQPEGNPPS